MKLLIWICASVLASQYRVLAISTPSDLRSKLIIIDTDIFSDVDDVGALAVANVLHTCGIADVQGVIINTDSQYGSLAASVINTYYNNPTIPIAALKPLTSTTFIDTRTFRLGDYASKLAHNFPRAVANASATPDPVPLYRSLLASAPNASTTLISLGFLTNLAALLSSPPDTISPLSGAQLVELKTAELVVMGGRYPSGHEFNFATDAASTRAVLAGWPENVPVTFVGYELGKRVVSGQRLLEWAPKDSPVLAAYQWYGDRCNTARASYDPVAVLYGILGLGGDGRSGVGEMFEFVGEGGCNVVAEDGGNEWKEGCGVRSQRWLRLRDGVREEEVGELLDRMYASGPLDERCCFGGGECGGSMKVQDGLGRLGGISIAL